MRKTCLVGFMKETKILVSTQKNAKLSDRSMTDNFIKMTVNGRFLLLLLARGYALTFLLAFGGTDGSILGRRGWFNSESMVQMVDAGYKGMI